jgi:hypothetical protein
MRKSDDKKSYVFRTGAIVDTKPLESISMQLEPSGSTACNTSVVMNDVPEQVQTHCNINLREANTMTERAKRLARFMDAVENVVKAGELTQSYLITDGDIILQVHDGVIFSRYNFSNFGYTPLAIYLGGGCWMMQDLFYENDDRIRAILERIHDVIDGSTGRKSMASYIICNLHPAADLCKSTEVCIDEKSLTIALKNKEIIVQKYGKPAVDKQNIQEMHIARRARLIIKFTNGLIQAKARIAEQESIGSYSDVLGMLERHASGGHISNSVLSESIKTYNQLKEYVGKFENALELATKCAEGDES